MKRPDQGVDNSGAGGRLVRLLQDFGADLRYGLRTWMRQPGLVAVAVLSLACGIGLNTAVFSIINAIFLQSIRGVPDADRIVTVGARVPFTTYRDIRDTISTLEGVAAWQPTAIDIRFRDLRIRGVAPVVSERYFSTLGVQPLRGRFFDTAAGRQPTPAAEVVLDHDFWVKSLGGDPSVVGEAIEINRIPAVILGIAPRAFHGFGPERPPLWLPMSMLPVISARAPRWEAAAESGWRISGGSRRAERSARSTPSSGRSPTAPPPSSRRVH